MKTRVNIFLVLISAFIAYFVESVASGKLLFIDGLLSERCSKCILDNSLPVIVVALLLNLALYLLSQWRLASKTQIQFYEAICEKVFKKMISSTDGLNPSEWKVTIMQACRRQSQSPYLKAVGRYQVKTPFRKSRISFCPGEGCAGLSYKINQLVRLEIPPSDPAKPLKYIDDCEKILKLPKHKAHKLNERACGYLCIPLPFFNHDHPWGILSIDCASQGNIGKLDARALETLMDHFSTFFRQENT